MSDGLALDDFLTHGEGGGGRKFLRNWKDDGSIVVVLHTQPMAKKKKIAWPTWTHPFNFRDTVKDKETGKEKEILAFRRFVSPDAEVVHQNQYFYNRPSDPGPEGVLQVPPILDPFLLLREWLRAEINADRLDPQEVIFEWTNPQKNNELTQWRAARIARLEKSTKATWNHSLDSKLEYLFVVVDAERPADGPQIVRVPKLLGDSMKKEIKAQIDSEGVDGGNPFITPYAFKWIYDKSAASAMNSYAARRFNKQEITEAIMSAITSDSFPDPSRDTTPSPGDKARIRAAFEDAAQIDLPWDLLFVDEWEDDAQPGTDFDPSKFSDDEDKEKPKGNPSVRTEEKTPPARETASSSGPKTRKRKRKKATKPAWDVPEDDRVACEDCGQHMHPGWAKCPACGAEYDLEGEDPVEAATLEQIAAAGWPVVKQEGAAANPKPATDDQPAEKADAGGNSDAKCWACGAEVGDATICPSCGIDLGDDIPFG